MNRRALPFILVVVIVIAAGAVTFPLWRPLFINDVVDEAFPGLTTEEQAFARAMPPEQQEVLAGMMQENAQMGRDTVAAMMAGDVEVTEVMPPEPVALLTGTFSGFDAIHDGQGRATIYQLPDGNHVLRFEDFRINNGPDLYVYLTTVRPTTIFESIGDDYVNLGNLKGNVGSQNYTIPAGTDYTRYNTVVIYCQPFRVNFVVAPLA
jgi:hypothetical protein